MWCILFVLMWHVPPNFPYIGVDNHQVRGRGVNRVGIPDPMCRRLVQHIALNIGTTSTTVTKIQAFRHGLTSRAYCNGRAGKPATTKSRSSGTTGVLP